jgi:hypothetical protein
MELETTFLHLRTPVSIGSRFGDWQVTWLGGWTRHRLSFIVMVVRVKTRDRRAVAFGTDAAAERTSKASIAETNSVVIISIWPVGVAF